MRKLFQLLLLCPAFAIAQHTFTVKGSGPGFVNGGKVYLVYKVDGKVMNDSATVTGQGFEIKGTAPDYTAATLYHNEDPMTIEVSYNSTRLYLEAGTIIVTNPDSLSRAVVSGTPANKDFMELKTVLAPAMMKYKQVVGAFESRPAKEQQDIDVVALFRQQLAVIFGEMEGTRMDFIKTHPNSYISAVVVADLKKSNASIKTLEAAYAMLGPTATATALGRSLGQEIASQVKVDIGQPAIDFSQPDIQGRIVKLSDFKDKYVLVDFWASWCGPCRAENPFVVKAYQEFKDKGFTVLGVSMDDQDTKPEWLQAIKNDKLEWTHVSDLKGMRQNTVAKLYGITLIPANFLVDPSGKIVAKNLKDKVLVDTLKRLLNGKP